MTVMRTAVNLYLKQQNKQKPRKYLKSLEGIYTVAMVTYLDTVSGAVEKADAADAVEDGVTAVLQHVVGADWRLALSLSGKDGAFHDSEIFFIQHLRHVWQLSTI